jgi:signal recognition particle subunit SRP54
VATDVYRPAAIDQLKTVGKTVEVPVFDMGTGTPPTEIAAQGLAKAKAEGYDVVIVDTAGRLNVDETMMQVRHGRWVCALCLCVCFSMLRVQSGASWG